MHVKMRMNYY